MFDYYVITMVLVCAHCVTMVW